MKIIILGILFYSINVFANGVPNPQMRVCLNTNSHFWVMEIEHPRKDSIGFCLFNDESMIGSLELINYFHYNTKTMALRAYLSSNSTKYHSCQSADAVLVKAVDSNLDQFELCRFTDDSFILKKTLINGFRSDSNIQLNSYL